MERPLLPRGSADGTDQAEGGQRALREDAGAVLGRHAETPRGIG